MEIQHLHSAAPSLDFDGTVTRVCGFGPIAAAARASCLIAKYQPEHVMLIGIAGTFDAQVCPVGSACQFTETVCDGIGIGTGESFITAAQLGWSQFNDPDSQSVIGDTLPLDARPVGGISAMGTLLTCCSASNSTETAAARHKRYPDAIAEDMEGFGVALACNLLNVPLQIVRGISNEVGDRNRDRWEIDKAMLAAAELAQQIIHHVWIPSQT